jgi:hypothetical protein
MRPGVAGFDSRGVGGKTMTWNAAAFRLSHRDLKRRSIDGAGEDWPFDYDDLPGTTASSAKSACAAITFSRLSAMPSSEPDSLAEGILRK